MISTDYSSYDFEDNIKEVTLHIDDAAITMAAHTIAGLKINGITESIEKQGLRAGSHLSASECFIEIGGINVGEIEFIIDKVTSKQKPCIINGVTINYRDRFESTKIELTDACIKYFNYRVTSNSNLRLFMGVNSILSESSFTESGAYKYYNAYLDLVCVGAKKLKGKDVKNHMKNINERKELLKDFISKICYECNFSMNDCDFEEKMILAVTIADLYMNGKGSGGFKIADYTHYDRIADYYRNLRIEELCLPQNIKKYSTGNRFDGTNILENVCSQMRGNSIEELSEFYISADMKYSLPFKDCDD